MDGKKYLNESRIFGWLAAFFLALGWLGFYLALIGRFSRWPLIIFLLASFAVTAGIIIRKKPRFKISEHFWEIFIFIIALITAYSLFTTPTIFSGRDQGSLSEAAIRLAQNQELEFSTPASREFFKVFPQPKEKFEDCAAKISEKYSRIGPIISPAVKFWCGVSASGKALNFPGFYYLKDGNLSTQFPLSYISWLAIFYSFFGLAGLVIANAVLLFIFLFSFYFLIAIFLKKTPAFLALFIAATSFPIFWFFKFTLSENMALALLWFGIWQLVLFLKGKNMFSYYAIWISFALLAFCRIEGLVVLIPLAIILIKNIEAKEFILQNKIDRLVLPLIFFFAFFLANFYVNFVFYKEMARVILGFSLKNSDTLQNGLWVSASQLFQIFSLYGIAYFTILALGAVIYFLKKRECLKLVPFFIALPVFFYLFDPKISTDHPWLLRRYVFAVLPACLFLSVLFLDNWLIEKRRKIFYGLLILMLAINLPLLVIYGPYSENKNLLSQVEILSRKIADNDLVLIDREASGDGWAMVSGPLSFLYGKQAVYFFNSSNLEKIDSGKFANIFLISPDKNTDYYLAGPLGEKLVFVKNYSLPSSHLEYLSKSENRLPLKIEGEVSGKIFKIVGVTEK